MAEISVAIVTNKSEWENFLKRENANFLQSWYWGEFHEQLGKTIVRTGFYQDEKLVGVMLSVVESAKRGRYLTVPAGPIIDWKNKKLVSKAFEQMEEIGKSTHCVFVR